MQRLYPHVSGDTAEFECIAVCMIYEMKKLLMIFDRHTNLKYKYGNHNFRFGGYYVDREEEMGIKEYIKNQLEENIMSE